MAFENIDFLNANSLRSYPIKEGSSKLSDDEVFTIPDDFIVDFMLCATSDVEETFYISKIINLPESVHIEIKDSSDVICGTFQIAVASHTLYKTYFMTAGDNYAGANGKLTIGFVTGITAAPTGTYTFAQAATEFETRTIIPSLNTVNRFICINADGSSFSTTGTVNIVARNNLKFTAATTTDPNDTIVIDVGNGLGLNAPCESDTPCIKTINNVEPDEDGNFTILGTDCASIEPLDNSNGIKFSDTCCKPCMGCDEVSTLTERVIQLETDMMKLRDHYVDLQNLINEFTNLMNYTCDCA